MADSPPSLSHPAAPRPILRRATVRRTSSDYEAPASPPARRQSESALLAARRGYGHPQIAMPTRPPLRPTRQSSRSVAFSSETEELEMGSVRSPRTPHTPTYPLLRTPDEPHASLFGRPTQFRPLWLLGMGNAGLALFSVGEVLIQRAIWPVKEYKGLNPTGPTVLPGGAPGHGTAFGSRAGAVAAGCAFMAVGVSAAIGSSVLFLQDGRRLNRAQNSGAPNYRRTHLYFAAHQLGIAILVVHKFVLEAYKGALPPGAAWAVALPGGFSQSLFAVTQAQSFSSSEVINGRMPIPHRGAVSAVARSMVASYIMLGAFVGTPNINAYGREAFRMVTAISTNVAYAMPLSTARLAGPSADLPVGDERYRGDWSAMQAFCLYAASRMVGTIASFWLSRSRWPAAPVAPPPSPITTQEAFRIAITDAFRGLPPPLPTLPPDWDETAAASVLMCIGFGMSVYSFSQFHRDATPPYWICRAQFAAATSSVLLGLTFRALQEAAKGHADFRLTWLATIPGTLAQALAFYAIPELFARSEASRHNAIISHRYQVIEACRFIGGMSWYLWASMSGILNFPPIARQMTIWAATTATLLGFSLPNADTLRAARGATPGAERGNPFDIHR